MEKHIRIDWLFDEGPDCETCGTSYAEGARVWLAGDVIFEHIPVAGCTNGHGMDKDEVYREVFKLLGYTVSITD